MAHVRDKYIPLTLTDVSRGAINMCADCGVAIWSKTIHNKACVVIREGQIKE